MKVYKMFKKKNLPYYTYYLDSYNVINAYEIFENGNYNYYLAHFKKEGDEWKFIKMWDKLDAITGSKNVSYPKQHLFFAAYRNGISSYVYNWQTYEFPVEVGTYDSLIHSYVEDGNARNYLDDYNCYIGKFTLSSDREESDIVTYYDYLEQGYKQHSFVQKDEPYFTILNIDGTIRDNKLFQGLSTSFINKEIDLNLYDSLEDFKEKRRKMLNLTKQSLKELYFKENFQPWVKVPQKNEEFQRILQKKN